MAFDYDKSYEAEKAKYSLVRKALEADENNIILGFLDIDEYPLEYTDGCSNQIIILYRSGKFETLPRGLAGAAIRDFLGIAYHRIVMWSVLPAAGAKTNPITSSGKRARNIPMSLTRDIYEC